MYRLDKASLRYDRKTVVHPTSLLLNPAELTVIVGPNGAGKSSLLKLVTGQTKPTSGTIYLNDDNIWHQKPALLAQYRAVLSQTTQLSFPFTVLEVVRLGMLNKESSGEIAAKMLKKVDLPGFDGRLFQQLSGGEQQRVQLARVLCQLETSRIERSKQFLFLDEPISSLDLKHQIMTLKIARSYCEQGVGVVAVLHDLNVTAAYSDRVIVMNNGLCINDGTPNATITDSTLRDEFDIDLKVGRVPESGTPFVLPHASRF